MPQTVLIVDDEEKIVEVVSSYLQAGGYATLTAHTGEEAFARLRQGKVALILLDLMLPDMSGEEICRRIRESSNVPIIMMTAKIDEESVVGGFALGADDYITKPFSPRQMVMRVEAVLRRGGDGSEQVKVLSAGELNLDMGTKRVTLRDNQLDLTASEYRILALLMQRPKRIYSRDEILSCIRDERFDGYDRVIDTHIKNLRQKIEDDPKHPHYVHTVYGMGYRFGG